MKKVGYVNLSMCQLCYRHAKSRMGTDGCCIFVRGYLFTVPCISQRRLSGECKPNALLFKPKSYSFLEESLLKAFDPQI